MNLTENILKQIIAENTNGKKGGTRKIADLPEEKICMDREHNPPMHYVYEPGIYEHVCPHCGCRQVFIVPAKPTL